ncbi:MAG: peptide deformylase [Elusimicrobia bacterium]|nr:peptide deformylase [Elusimicrobiota bacterium]
MPIRPILLFPHPTLKEVCPKVTEINTLTAQTLTDLTDTLYSTPGVGIAAPQIGTLLRAIVVDVTWLPPRQGKEPPKGHGKIALLNPRVVQAEGSLTFREGCLSIPEFLANVRRSSFVRVEGLDRDGNLVTYESEGFEAVALQHEIDHLDGLLFLDRVADIKTDLFRRKQPPLSSGN